MIEQTRGTRAEVVVACDDLSATLAFFTDRLGFQLEMITPADSPRVAVIYGHGIRLRLDASAHLGARTGAGADPTVRLQITGDAALVERLGSQLVAPNGTIVDVATAHGGPEVPIGNQAFEFSRFADSGFDTGRAGMGYRDLMPGRQGGRYIASHIQIPEAGPVPDYVHYHHIRFQMIYCRRGRARLVYEDQGPPFEFEAGDCVLQPPEIRHRVLESSAGLEVVEIGCPADHETRTDPDLELPTDVLRPQRRFGDQFFVRHVAAEAKWTETGNGLRHRDLGIAAATEGLASARVLRPAVDASATPSTEASATEVSAAEDLDFQFLFVCEGEADLTDPDGIQIRVAAGDSFTMPSGSGSVVNNLSPTFEALEVTVATDGTSLS